MKNKILFLVSIILFIIGIVFKLIELPLGGTLIALGIILFIVWISILYASKDKVNLNNILMLVISIALAAFIFKFIQFRGYLEILIPALLIGLISFLITIIVTKNKKGKNAP
jgi:hypothetical protein